MRWTLNGLGRKKEDKDNNNQSIFTKETLGVVLVLFATLCLVCLITRGAVFSAPGKFVNAFLFGCFGIFAYAVVFFVVIIGVLLITDKKTGLSTKRKALFTLAFSLIALIAHVISMSGKELGYGEYIAKSYDMAAGGFSTASGGGLFVALIAYPLSALLTDAGCYVVLGIALATTAYFIVKDYTATKSENKQGHQPKFKSSFVKEEKDVDVEIVGEKDYPVDGVVLTAQPPKQKLFVNNPNDFTFKNKRELANDDGSQALKLGFSNGGLGVVSTPQEKTVTYSPEDYKKKLEYIKTPAALDVEALRNNSRPSYTGGSVNTNNLNTPFVSQSSYGDNQNNYTSVSDYINPRPVEPETVVEEKKEETPFIARDNGVTVEGDTAGARAENFERLYAEVEDVKEQPTPIENDVVFRAVEEGRIEEIVEEQTDSDIPFIEENYGEIEETVEPVEEMPAPSPIRSERRVRDIFFTEENAEEEKTEESPREAVGFTSRATSDNNFGARRGLNIETPRVEQKEEEKPKKPAPPINRE